MPFHAPATLPSPDQLSGLPAPLAARLLCRHFGHQAQVAVAHLGMPGHEGTTARFKLRVALRRLRVTLEAYEPELQDTVPRKLARRAQALARRIGPIRDREVQDALLTTLLAARTKAQRDALERSALRLTAPDASDPADASADDALATDLRARWLKLATPLQAALGSWHEIHHLDGPRAALPFGVIAADALDHAAARIARRMHRITDANDRAALHAARLSIKAARYLLKPLAGTDANCAAMLDSLSHAQDQLGAINDAHALLIRVAEVHDALMADGQPARSISAGTAGLAHDLTTRIHTAFAALASWREPDALQQRIGELADIAESWRSASSPPLEIERKWLLSALPPRVRGLSPALLRQGYLPGEALVERIRSVTHGDGATEWIRTVKVGRGMSRIEIEEVTTTTLGETLFALTDGKRVEKRRYAVTDGPLTWEIDDFTDRALVLAEVELPSEDTPVEPPSWLAPYIVRDVTGEVEFTNWKLAR